MRCLPRTVTHAIDTCQRAAGIAVENIGWASREQCKPVPCQWRSAADDAVSSQLYHAVCEKVTIRREDHWLSMSSILCKYQDLDHAVPAAYLSLRNLIAMYAGSIKVSLARTDFGCVGPRTALQDASHFTNQSYAISACLLSS